MSVSLKPLAAKPNLVINARCTLQVGTVAGVDHGAHELLLEADRLGGDAGDNLVDGRMIFESREMLLPMHIVAHGDVLKLACCKTLAAIMACSGASSVMRVAAMAEPAHR